MLGLFFSFLPGTTHNNPGAVRGSKGSRSKFIMKPCLAGD